MTSRRSDEPAERLFAALFPPPAVQRALHARALELLAPIEARLRIPAAGSLHLTLRFFGAIESERARKLADALAERLDGSPAPELVLDEVGSFGGARPRVVWLGAHDRTPPRLAELAAHAEAAARAIGLAPETRPHRPHLTLARVRSPGRDRSGPPRRLTLPDALRAWRPNVTWRPDRALLIRSVHAPGGARYEERAAFRLDGSGPR